MLGHYLAQVHGYKFLNEYFNLNFRGVSVRHREFFVDHDQWSNIDRHKQLSPQENLAESALRFEFLKKVASDIFLKHFHINF